MTHSSNKVFDTCCHLHGGKMQLKERVIKKSPPIMHTLTARQTEWHKKMKIANAVVGYSKSTLLKCHSRGKNMVNSRTETKVCIYCITTPCTVRDWVKITSLPNPELGLSLKYFYLIYERAVWQLIRSRASKWIRINDSQTHSTVKLLWSINSYNYCIPKDSYQAFIMPEG